ncbi:anaphase-promoting complex subunit 1 [Cucumis melo var. makuwa]|uniref:Anaphase-promoting complex subunit 1 n=1 Tax=Cucumis melo var. makuwa TaxID=1194695 RepID=A0A5D3CSA5_CUCMM|nr:anaphase-promoting complex subunit 1 [Cucumis melo var. makuwa]
MWVLFGIYAITPAYIEERGKLNIMKEFDERTIWTSDQIPLMASYNKGKMQHSVWVAQYMNSNHITENTSSSDAVPDGVLPKYLSFQRIWQGKGAQTAACKTLCSFFIFTFNMISERNIDETLDNLIVDGTQTEETAIGISVAVDARINVTMEDLFCRLWNLPVNPALQLQLFREFPPLVDARMLRHHPTTTQPQPDLEHAIAAFALAAAQSPPAVDQCPAVPPTVSAANLNSHPETYIEKLFGIVPAMAYSTSGLWDTNGCLHSSTEQMIPLRHKTRLTPYQLDVKNAFLDGVLEEEVYSSPLLGFEAQFDN